MGAQTSFEMEWNRVLDNKFVTLSFKNERVNKDNQANIFKSHAYYKINNNDSVESMWFDFRGIYFPLKGIISTTELTIEWGSVTTEQGKMIYKLKPANELIVTDFILKEG